MTAYFPSKHFSRAEFACKCGCGLDTIDYSVVAACMAVREHFKRKVKITSGCRCKAHNKAVGGSVGSQHLRCRAADIVVEGVPPKIVADFLEKLGVGGIGRYSTFTHLDTRHGRARWNG